MTKTQKQIQGEQTRQRIIEEAANLFVRKGFHGTSIADLAQAVGLTKGALYHHFRAKEEILFELVQEKHRQLIEALSSMPQQRGRPADLLHVLLESIPEARFADFGNYLDFWVQAARIPKIRSFLNECIKEYNQVFAERIDLAYAPTRRDRHDLAVMILAMRDGLTVRKMLGDTEVDFPRQLKLFASLVEGKMNKDKNKAGQKI